MAKTQTNRLYYFDVLKGIAIFMVVMGHVLCLAMTATAQSLPQRLISSIHMPMFFFISGWFSYKMSSDGKWQIPSIPKRFVQLIVPMVVVSLLFLPFFNYVSIFSPSDTTYYQLWQDPAKLGYWFNLTLFEIILIFRISCPILSRCKRFSTLLFASLVLYALIMTIYFISPNEIKEILYLRGLSVFFPAFIIGCIAHRYKESFLIATQNSKVMSLAIATLAVTLSYLYYANEIPLNQTIMHIIVRPICYICLALIAVAIAKPSVEKQFAESKKPSRFTKIWIYLGENSLGIYLLHYFFLFRMPSVEQFLSSTGCSFVPTTFVAIICATIIVATTAGIIELLRPSKLLSLLLTGKN